MSISGSSWLKFGLFTVGLGQSFVFVLVPPLARDLGLSEIQTSSIFAISALAWASTSAFWGRTSDKYGRRNIAILGLVGYSISLIALIPNILSIGSVLGLMGILNIPLDMMTITIAAISMGIAVDNTIHYIFRHKKEFTKYNNYETAMIKTHNSIGYALYYTTLTIIVGFSILVFSNS